MKQWVSYLLAIALSTVVLASTTSFSVYSHFCGAFLQDISFFAPGDGCGMEMADSCDADHEKPSCCNDEHDSIKGQDDIKLSSFDFALDIAFLPSNTKQDFSALQIYKESGTENMVYTRPPPDTPLFILYETFLI